MALVIHRHPNRSASAPTRRFMEHLRDAAAAALAWPGNVIRYRKMLRCMGQMSDYELGDIGLTRADLSDATAVPFGEDPSGLFVTRRRERRGEH